MDDEYERFRRGLRPRGIMRWLNSWDTDVVLATIGLFIVAIFVFIYVMALLPSSEEAKQHARGLLQKTGYEDIQIEDVGYFSCGEGDVPSESAAFRALTHDGMRVEGAVCCGWFKNCTIRYR